MTTSQVHFCHKCQISNQQTPAFPLTIDTLHLKFQIGTIISCKFSPTSFAGELDVNFFVKSSMIYRKNWCKNAMAFSRYDTGGL